MPLPQLLQCRRQSLHQSLHNLARSEVDTALVMVLVAVADADVADVDVADVDVADADGAGADEADAVWAQHVA